MFLSIGFFAIFFVVGNLDYSTVFSLSPFLNESLVNTEYISIGASVFSLFKHLLINAIIISLSFPCY